MSEKIFLDANSLARDSFSLAKKIYDSGWIPDAIIALWRGGSPVGISVHEFLHYKGISCYHTIVKAVSYTGIEQKKEPRIENIDYVLKLLKPTTKVLVVDDVFDSGSTAEVMRRELTKVSNDVKFAMVYYKPLKNTTDFEPDFYVTKTENWLVFPHELMGLTPEEVAHKDSFIYSLLDLHNKIGTQCRNS